MTATYDVYALIAEWQSDYVGEVTAVNAAEAKRRGAAKARRAGYHHSVEVRVEQIDD